MAINKTISNLNIIGPVELVDVVDVKKVPAKIDTGADTSSIWASDIDMKKDGTLVFKLFGPKSSYYTGSSIEMTEYKARIVRSSHGDTQIRYQVKLPIVLGSESFETTFNLSHRSRNSLPILIGRHTIEGRFLVDVSKTSVERPKKPSSIKLNQELSENPYEFHQKYIKNKGAN